LPHRTSADAITDDAFSARLAALAAPRRFAVAVSGGRDSMALARLCAQHVQKTGADILALTVDHGLRAEAAGEAVKTKAWCEAAGLRHLTLRWKGVKPSSGVQAAARTARYRLLIDAAKAAGAQALMTAHTIDDQAETLFMRLSRGAGGRGLAAMREETFVAAGAGAPLRLLRPMLAFSRAAVTGFLCNLGQQYVDDPSNEDDGFERVRVRALLAALAEQDLLTAPALAETARRLSAADERLRAQEDALFNAIGGCLYGWGGASLDTWPAYAPGSAALASRLIYAVGGAEHRPDERAAAEAMAQAASGGAATLAGALIKFWRAHYWFFREPAALLGRAGVAPAGLAPLNHPVLWDRRFILDPGTVAGLEAGPMGARAQDFLGLRAGLFQGPPEALAALPGVYRGGVLIGAPALPFMRLTAARAASLIWERYDGGIVRFS
jgi:tRNA(Ile)-lysidine synthase